MYVIVYTVIVKVGDLEVNADYYHACVWGTGRPRFCPLGKKLAVRCAKKVGNCGRDKSNFSPSARIIERRVRAFRLKRLTRGRKFQDRCKTKKKVKSCQISKEESSPQTSLNSPCDTTLQKYEGVVSASWGPQETQAWLQTHRYTAHLQTLASFSGTDLLRLSKENLIQLCGLPDGIRLYNALHARAIPPRLTLYLCVESEGEIYEGVFLTERSRRELVKGVAGKAGIRGGQVGGLYLQGPAGLRVAVTDDLVQHLPDHAAFTLDVLAHDRTSDIYQLILKRVTTNHPPS